MDTCKYIHYEVDYSTAKKKKVRRVSGESNPSIVSGGDNVGNAGNLISVLGARTVLYPPQWLQCDLRFFDLSVLGKFSVIMADPPWDIHMELPYGTMSDDEMRRLSIMRIQDEGLIFLWVTGR